MVTVACAVAILVPLSAHAQTTHDFTLTNDPALCQSSCSTVLGSGMMTVSPTQFSSIRGNG
jgi:hypothetical protein